MNRIARVFLTLCCALALPVAEAAIANAPALKSGMFEPPRQAPEFSLRGSDGSELKLSRYRGKVVMLGFGFIDCPNVCPVTLAVLADARRALGTAASDVQVVYVTVDPERDDAATMRAYLAHFDPSFIGGTGAPDQLAAVRKDYGISATKVGTGKNYAIDHSSFVYLIDRDGKLRSLMPYGRTAADYVHDVKLLLAK